MNYTMEIAVGFLKDIGSDHTSTYCSRVTYFLNLDLKESSL